MGLYTHCLFLVGLHVLSAFCNAYEILEIMVKSVYANMLKC